MYPDGDGSSSPPLTSKAGGNSESDSSGSGSVGASSRSMWRKSLKTNKSRIDRGDQMRSEEHTSELQSLMRNSYAVFCLKQKSKLITTTQVQTQHTSTHI